MVTASVARPSFFSQGHCRHLRNIGPRHYLARSYQKQVGQVTRDEGHSGRYLYDPASGHLGAEISQVRAPPARRFARSAPNALRAVCALHAVWDPKVARWRRGARGLPAARTFQSAPPGRGNAGTNELAHQLVGFSGESAVWERLQLSDRSPARYDPAVIVPNRPSFSSLGPAVKNSVLVGPLTAPAPRPNCSAHNPSIVIGLWSPPRSVPAGCQVPSGACAYAWIVPSPKLPTSRSPLNVPKLSGAFARPHGASSCPRVATRWRRLPSRSNASTKPSPWPSTSSSASASCLA